MSAPPSNGIGPTKLPGSTASMGCLGRARLLQGLRALVDGLHHLLLLLSPMLGPSRASMESGNDGCRLV